MFIKNLSPPAVGEIKTISSAYAKTLNLFTPIRHPMSSLKTRFILYPKYLLHEN